MLRNAERVLLLALGAVVHQLWPTSKRNNCSALFYTSGDFKMGRYLVFTEKLLRLRVGQENGVITVMLRTVELRFSTISASRT